MNSRNHESKCFSRQNFVKYFFFWILKFTMRHNVFYCSQISKKRIKFHRVLKIIFSISAVLQKIWIFKFIKMIITEVKLFFSNEKFKKSTLLTLNGRFLRWKFVMKMCFLAVLTCTNVFKIAENIECYMWDIKVGSVEDFGETFNYSEVARSMQRCRM